MRKLFTYKFNGEGFRIEDYLYDMMAATQDGKLYIARTIAEDGSYYEVAEREEDMNCVSVVTMDWNVDPMNLFSYVYEGVVRSLRANESDDLSNITGFWRNGVRAKAFEQRAKRLWKLFQIKAPRQVITKEMHSLLEEMIFNYFGVSYQDIILVNSFNPPEKGSKEDLENKKIIRKFIDGYEDMTSYIANKKDFRFVDFQKEFKIGYFFADYVISNLESNGFVSNWKGNCIYQGVELEEFERIEIDATPYDKDTKILDESTEGELLQALGEEK